MQAVGGQGAQQIQWPAQPIREVNLVRFATYDGTTDPVTWIEDFEKAAIANRLTNDWKLEVVHAYLTGTAHTWYQDHNAANNITH